MIEAPGAGPSLILASASPRRRDLLAQIHIKPDRIEPAFLDETAHPDETPRQLAGRLAAAKAGEIATANPGHFVLGADTVVAVGRRLLPKAKTQAEARRCLSLLSGRRHQVISGVSLVTPSGSQHTRQVTSTVAFKRLSRAEADLYLSSGEWRGKAGGYAIQGLAGAFVRFLQGSYSNVVGLPLYETAMMLAGNGFPLAIRAEPDE